MQFLKGQELIDRIRGKKHKYYQKSYSQDGEDVVLASFFEKELNSDFKGFYVDIGSHHPLRFSNTQFFYEKGWKGINIDATPGSMNAFKKVRPFDINLEVGISDKQGEMFYHLFEESALNCFDKEVANERLSEGWPLIEKICIKTHPINDILDEYLPKNSQIDFIDIDVEGFELQILSQFNFDKYAPKYFLTEALDNIEQDLFEYKDSDIFKLLTKHGYKIYAKTHRTIIWGENEL